MAAYNSGEGRVDNAVAKSGYADFWEIYSRGLLPTETRNYVPNILATIIIAKNPQRYGFQVTPEPALKYDFVQVNSSVDLRLVADVLNTSYDYLLGFNPELKRGVTPPGMEHAIRVPAGTGKSLQTALKVIPPDRRASWRMVTAQPEDTFAAIAQRTGVSESLLSQINGGSMAAGQKIIVPLNSGIQMVAASAPKGTLLQPVAAGTRIVTYRVKTGETIGELAGRYGVSADDIAALNGISSISRLKPDQVIKVPVGK